MKVNISRLMFPFYESHPLKFLSKFRWFLNKHKHRFLWLLNLLKSRFTIIEGFGSSPGDTIITSIVIHTIKQKYPRLRINFISAYPELVCFDPQIETLNQQETILSIRSWYLDHKTEKISNQNILESVFNSLNIKNYKYKSYYYLTGKEDGWARNKLLNLRRPIIAINTKSKESVKNWPKENWLELIKRLKHQVSLIQLGDHTEEEFGDVLKYAGKLTMRESCAILGQTNLFIGPDSFLMHVANGLKVPGVIIFGGSRLPECLGYEDNVNISSRPDCSPCWIHEADGDICQNKMKCMHEISVNFVYEKVKQSLDKKNQLILHSLL